MFQTAKFAHRFQSSPPCAERRLSIYDAVAIGRLKLGVVVNGKGIARVIQLWLRSGRITVFVRGMLSIGNGDSVKEHWARAEYWRKGRLRVVLNAISILWH